MQRLQCNQKEQMRKMNNQIYNNNIKTIWNPHLNRFLIIKIKKSQSEIRYIVNTKLNWKKKLI